MHFIFETEYNGAIISIEALETKKEKITEVCDFTINHRGGLSFKCIFV